MKTTKLSLLILLIQFVPLMLIAQGNTSQSGADLFRQNCGACHTVGKGKLVGPDLLGVEKRHNDTWLTKWIKSSQTMVNAGDPAAKKLFADNAMIPMPDQPLTNDQIKTVLSYIKGGASEPVVADPPVAPAVAVSTEVVPPNNGYTPLVMSGTPAVFTTAKPTEDNSNWGGNKWLVMIVILCAVGFITTSAAWIDVVKDEHAAK